jgi:oligoendopeptidase F
MPEVSVQIMNLNDILPSHSSKYFEKFIEELDSKVKAFEKIKYGLSKVRREDVLKALTLYSEITEIVSKLRSYAYLLFSGDTLNQKYRSLLSKAEDISAEVENRTLSFRLWWVSLKDEVSNNLLPEDKDFAYFLRFQRKFAPYTLEEKVEQAINLKNTTGLAGWKNLYDELTSSFLFEIKLEGKRRKLPQSELSKLFFSPVGKVRENAYRSLLKKYAENGDILGEIYKTIVRDWANEFIRMRHYKSPISPRNLENNLADEPVETLLSVCRKRADIFHEFFRIKAKILGLKKMSRYHIYAPYLVKKKGVKFDEAVSLLIDTFLSFDREYGEFAKKIFELKHVDYETRRGKRTGAFCMPVTPKIVPYLHVNFTGTEKDIYTLAHELGHGVHSQMASSHSILTWEPPLVLAETASTFAELIVFERLVSLETNPSLRVSMLLDRLTSLYSTIVRQAFIVLFEKIAHEQVGGGATIEDLCKRYYENLKEQFADSMEINEEFRWEWTYIPHIYRTPFYCYSYAFGNLLSLSFYDLYLKEGSSFVKSYKEILSYGGAMAPEEILQKYGIDISTREPWERGFNVITRMINEIKRLNPRHDGEKYV